MNLYLSFGKVCSFRIIIQSFLTRPTSSHHVPHIPSIVPATSYASILCVFRDLLSSFSCVGHATMPYSSTDRLSSGNQSPQSLFHCMPTPWRATYFPQFFVQKKQFHLHPYLSGHYAASGLVFNPRLFFLSFQTEQLRHYFCLPPFNFFQCLLRPRPSFTSKGENGVHVIHQSLTFYSPRNIVTLVHLVVLPRGLVCRLHSFFHSVACFPVTIHHTSQYPEFVFKMKCVATF